MSQREITDSELINGSMGVHGDIHDNKTNCKPILKRAWYSEGSYPVCEVLAYFRYCNCGNYNRAECERILKKFQTTGVRLPTKGLTIHRLGCSYKLTPIPTFYFRNNIQKTEYIYEHNCICMYTDRPRTAFCDPTNRGEFVVYMYNKR